VFADIDDDTMTLDPERAAEAITPRTRAIVPVHLNGFPCAIAPLRELCDEHGLALIEDCAQAFGARRAGVSVGGSELGCFSLHPLKVLAACGDGGFVTAHTDADADRLRQLRNHGLLDRDRCAVPSINSRLDTVLAALLLVKLDYVDEWLATRRAHATAYRAALSGLVRLPPEHAECEPVHCPFVIRHPAREAIADSLAKRGVDTRIHYPIAIHKQAAYAGVRPPRLPVTERVVEHILSLPSSAELTVAQRDHVIESIREALREIRT
jgi:dTDP-4-amino-4,6-dideoxygalactose transaminase